MQEEKTHTFLEWHKNFAIKRARGRRYRATVRARLIVCEGQRTRTAEILTNSPDSSCVRSFNAKSLTN